MDPQATRPDVGVTAAFAALLHDWAADAPALEERCRLLLLDGLAVAVAGAAAEPGPGIAAGLARRAGAAPVATVIGQGLSTGVVQAARINGMAMHVLDYEPMWNPPNHALSPLLPALLAVAEAREAEGAPPQGLALLRALAKGIEAQGRLRLSSGQLEPARLSLHPPGVVGPIAAALACADLLGLGADGMATAAGIAASRCGGVLANVGSMVKALHCGDAAANGAEAALLAAAGLEASPDALGGPRGWGIALFGAGFDPSALLAPIGVGRALDPGPAWKLFPSQFATHFAITAALDVHARFPGFHPSTIERIVITAPPMPYIDRPRPASGLDGKFSWQYTTAVALLDGRVDPPSFTDDARFRPELEALLDRTELVGDPTIPGRFDQMHTRLTVHSRGSAAIETRCDAPLGSWTRPIPATRVMDKARGLLAGLRPSETIEKLVCLATVGPEFPVTALGRLVA